MTQIRCLLEEASYISTHEPGIIQGETIVLFSEWNRLASLAAARLRAAGVNPGDRVSLFMANGWRMLVILMGVMRCGAIACPLSTRLPRSVILGQMSQIGSRFLVAVLAADGAEDDFRNITVFAPDMLAAPDDAVLEESPPVVLDDPALILFTSGTTGQPRPAVLSYGNLYYNARGANLNMRIHSRDRWLLSLPLYHVSGLGIVFRCLLGGAAVIIPDQKLRLMEALRACRPSHISVVPAQLWDLVHDPAASEVKGLQAVLVGGDSLEPGLAAACAELSWPVYPTYGLTEMGSQVTTLPPVAPESKRIGTSGRLLRHRQLRVDETGEILVRGSCLFLGYWEDGTLRLPVDAGGWYHTGDLGMMDDEDYLVVRGRKDNLIISGGENIQPEEIEKHLMALAGVQAAVVVPVPHPRFGQRPVAFVKADRMDAVSWSAALRESLPAFKVPDAFFPWPGDVAVELKPPRRLLSAKAQALAHDSGTPQS